MKEGNIAKKLNKRKKISKTMGILSIVLIGLGVASLSPLHVGAVIGVSDNPLNFSIIFIVLGLMTTLVWARNGTNIEDLSEEEFEKISPRDVKKGDYIVGSFRDEEYHKRNSFYEGIVEDIKVYNNRFRVELKGHRVPKTKDEESEASKHYKREIDVGHRVTNDALSADLDTPLYRKHNKK